MSSRTVIRRFTTQIKTFNKMSANQSHATNSQTQSAVPNAVQNAAPESVERALPDSVSLAPSILISRIMILPSPLLHLLPFHHPSYGIEPDRQIHNTNPNKNVNPNQVDPTKENSNVSHATGPSKVPEAIQKRRSFPHPTWPILTDRSCPQGT